MESYIGYIGTDAKGADGGIRVIRADGATGSFEVVQQLENFDWPCYFSISRDKKLMVSARSNPDAPSPISGMISSLRISPDGTLTPINAMPAVCERPPCHSCISPDNKFAYTSHFLEGRSAVFSLSEDGALWGPIQVIQQEGSGEHPIFQRSPHVHYGCFTPDGKYLLHVDLGMDVIHVFEPGEKGLLAKVKDIDVVKGAGCRHLVFSKDGRFIWVISEIGCLVTSFSYNDGEFELIETVPTLDDAQMKERMKGGSAIRLSPDGSLLFAGNRFVDNIAVFRTGADGRLTRTANVPCVFPRDLNILPNGKFLYVCTQDKNIVEVFSVDYENSTIRPTGEKVDLPLPTCIEFL